MLSLKKAQGQLYLYLYIFKFRFPKRSLSLRFHYQNSARIYQMKERPNSFREMDEQMIGVRFPAGAGNFYLHHSVQNGSGAHPASYPMSTRGSFPGGKAAGA
jgi:hypothetical protein